MFHIEDARTWDPTTVVAADLGITGPAQDSVGPATPPPARRCSWTSKKPPRAVWVPHGMMTGMTGSGKSGPAAVRPVDGDAAFPKCCNCCWSDFKGESAFAPLADLPHANGGVISNMARKRPQTRPVRGRAERGGCTAAADS